MVHQAASCRFARARVPVLQKEKDCSIAERCVGHRVWMKAFLSPGSRACRTCAWALVIFLNGCTDHSQHVRAGAGGQGATPVRGQGAEGGSVAHAGSEFAPISDALEAILASVDPRLVEATGCDDDVESMRAQVADVVSSSIDRLFEIYAWRCHRDDWVQKLASRDGEGTVVELWIDTQFPFAPGKSFDQVSPLPAEFDAADIVKTDGEYLYVAGETDGKVVRIIDVWPPEQTHEVGRIVVPGYARQVLVEQDRLVIYTSAAEPNESGAFAATQYRNYTGPYCLPWECDFARDGRQSVLQVFDISDRSAPALLRQIKTTGSLVTMRRTRGLVQAVVLDDFLRLPPVAVLPEVLTGWHPELPPGEVCGATSTYAEAEALFLAAQARAAQQLAALPAKALLPSVEDSSTGNTSSPCDKYLEAVDPLVKDGTLESEPGGYARAFMSVISFELREQSPAAITAFRTLPGPVHAASDAVYFGVPAGLGGAHLTTVHKFDTSSGSARYAASGVAAGLVPTRWMDGHAGMLRVAGTLSAESFGYQQTAMTVLTEEDGRLRRVGTVGRLPGNLSVGTFWFDGDHAFIQAGGEEHNVLLVTDLSDAAQPRLVSKLLEPGVIEDLELVAPGHLLAIDRHQLQLFDLTEPDAPKRAYSAVFNTEGTPGVGTPAAIAYSAVTGRLILPTTVCAPSAKVPPEPPFNGVMVYGATSGVGFEHLGTVRHPVPDPWPYPLVTPICSGSANLGLTSVRRAAWIGDYLYSVSSERLNVNHVADLAQDVAVVRFDP